MDAVRLVHSWTCVSQSYVDRPTVGIRRGLATPLRRAQAMAADTVAITALRATADRVPAMAVAGVITARRAVAVATTARRVEAVATPTVEAEVVDTPAVVEAVGIQAEVVVDTPAVAVTADIANWMRRREQRLL
jgi:hypothetical protein